MIASMTAFGRADAETPFGSLSWELRSVNHRYLETSLRLPEELRALDGAVRERINQRLARGKIDASLRFKPEAATAELTLDEDLIARLTALSERVDLIAKDAAALRAIDYLRWPGVLISPPLDVEALTQAALGTLDAALAELIATRNREGARLKTLLDERLAGMRQVVGGVGTIAPTLAADFRARLNTKLAEFRQTLDPARLEQEVVLFAQRADVDEELGRLGAHIAEVARVLEKGGAVGRRLDFLMQELNREANTLGSKAADIRLTNAAVELKVLIEQMREQVQNLE